MRIAAWFVLTLAAGPVAAADSPGTPAPIRVLQPFESSVSLDRPGALDALKAANPAHYERAVGILRVASEMPCEGLPRVIQADFQAVLAQCEGAMLRTSWPAKRDVAFVLDGTRYTARVTLTEREVLVPLVGSR